MKPSLSSPYLLVLHVVSSLHSNTGLIMVPSDSHLAYWVTCVSLICMFLSLLTPSSHSFFTLPPVRGLLTVVLMAVCWSWTVDYQAMYNMPVFTVRENSCESRVEMLEFKQDYAKLQRDVYLKALGIAGLLVCLIVAVKEKKMQREREYYQTSLKTERQQDRHNKDD